MIRAGKIKCCQFEVHQYKNVIANCMAAQPQLHVTRLRRKLSGAFFEYLASSKARFGSQTPDHVNKPLVAKTV
jgi:hypothetical protein